MIQWIQLFILHHYKGNNIIKSFSLGLYLYAIIGHYNFKVFLSQWWASKNCLFSLGVKTSLNTEYIFAETGIAVGRLQTLSS